MFTKIRTVKPSYHSSRSISSVSVEAAYVGIALLALCDDEGYFEADPQVIKGSLFPRRNDIDFESSIKELEGIEFLEISSCSKGYPYGFIPNFSRDQIIRSDRFRSSEIKKLCKWKPREKDMTDMCPSPDSHLTDGNRKGKGKERNIPFLQKAKKEEVSFSKNGKRKKEITLSEKRRIKIDQDPDERMRILNDCFNRRHSTKWTILDFEMLQDINPSIEECELMKKFYSKKASSLQKGETNYWKSDLSTMLNQFDQQLDRAAASVGTFEEDPKPQKNFQPEPANWRENLKEEFPQFDENKWSWYNLNETYPDIAEKCLRN